MLIVLLFLFQGLQISDIHSNQHDQVLIKEALLVNGLGTPVEGPYDILIEDNKIKKISRFNRDARANVKVQIDAKGKYVLPGFHNMHAHIMDSRGGMDMPVEYSFKLWLASGITTLRDLGSNFDKTSKLRAQSRKNEIIAPRINLYPVFSGMGSERDVRGRIKALKDKGADGVKIIMVDKETFGYAHDEANKRGLKVANHVGVEDMNAWDNMKWGTTTIEHWYGVPDAAFKGEVQNFPPDFNYSNEYHRFKYAGRLWREADPEKLDLVLKGMVDAGVAWDPTLCIYEASRDLQRALTFPWFQDYLHPGLEEFFKPDPESHGSYFWNWTATDESYWKENYQIWFKALKRYSELGGTITTGEDAGFIYQMFGFGYLRELQLHEEAGFHPLTVIKHATSNSAKVLGQGKRLGAVKEGYLADLVIVNANPIENLQALMPRGIHPITTDGRKGGIEWTIKDGIPYHAPTLLEDVKQIVKDARKKKSVNYLVK
jgi:imidazolonepropionase-like amidohydrolase